MSKSDELPKGTPQAVDDRVRAVAQRFVTLMREKLEGTIDKPEALALAMFLVPLKLRGADSGEIIRIVQQALDAWHESGVEAEFNLAMGKAIKGDQ